MFDVLFLQSCVDGVQYSMNQGDYEKVRVQWLAHLLYMYTLNPDCVAMTTEHRCLNSYNHPLLLTLTIAMVTRLRFVSFWITYCCQGILKIIVLGHGEVVLIRAEAQCVCRGLQVARVWVGDHNLYIIEFLDCSAVLWSMCAWVSFNSASVTQPTCKSLYLFL